MTNTTLFNNIQAKAREIANLGVKYDDLVVKNSQAVGATESRFLKQGVLGDEAMMYTLAMSDTTVKKYIAYFDKDYRSRREFLRKFSMNGEIQWILDTLADEAIIQDERNFFCYPSPITLDLSEEIKKAFEDNFNRIYTFWRFNDDTTAWQYFYQLLVDGFLAFEIIYADSNGKEFKDVIKLHEELDGAFEQHAPTDSNLNEADKMALGGLKVIGFKELDATTLRPGVEKQPDGTFKNVWYQHEEDVHLRRKLYDSQIIYISYAKGNSISRVSYVERLIRSFNLLRIMEHTRVIWNVMNSAFRLKMVVPIGNKSPQKARESLGELMSIYREDVRLDFDSGELFINGRPNIQFYKNYMFPSKNGEQTDISVIGGEGPDLSDMGALGYFYDKLKLDSKIPMGRFDRAGGGGTFTMGSDGVDREEIRFSKFINRLRSIFQEIIMKPLYLQMILDFPEIKDDELFKGQIGLRFNKDNVFERTKEMDLLGKSVEFINALKEIKTIKDGQERDFFHPQFLIERWMFLNKGDIDLNEKYWTDHGAAEGEPEGESPKKKKGGEEEGFKL